MGKINWGRVFLGGLVAGIVINIGEFLFHGVIFKTQVEEAVKFAEESPYPTGDELWKDVYKQDDYPFTKD